MMTGMPWFTWVAIVAIVMWGLVMIFGKSSIMSKSNIENDNQRREIEHLKRRIDELEARLDRPSS